MSTFITIGNFVYFPAKIKKQVFKSQYRYSVPLGLQYANELCLFCTKQTLFLLFNIIVIKTSVFQNQL